MKPYVLGIDPGLSGAYAIINQKEIVFVDDFPLLLNPKTGKRTIDIQGFCTMIEMYVDQIAFCAMEDVSAGVFTSPGQAPRQQGSVSAFNFGKSVGVVQGVLESFNIPIFPVKPAVWKILMGLGRDKGASIEKARSIFKNAPQYLKLKKDHGKAEALLLAYFGMDRMKLKE